MKSGYVYILTNPSYKDEIIKIGYTQNLKRRLNDLDKTGVPTPFEPYLTVKTAKYKTLEKVIHHELDKLTEFRTRKNREFFEINPVDAADLLVNLSKLIDDAEVEEYGGDVEVRSATKKGSSNRTTFALLKIPVGAKLEPTNKKIPKATVVDEANQVRLENGEIKSISRAVIDAVGGHRNGFQSYTYKGENLYEMRKKILK